MRRARSIAASLRWASLLCLAPLSTSVARAQQSASHFTYTGVLRVDGDAVAETHLIPLRSVRFASAGHIEMSLRHEGLRMQARGDSAGLQFHVHAWTSARALGFTVFVAPETLVDVAEGSTSTRVIFSHAQLGDVRLGRAHALPAWLTAHIAGEAQHYTHCDAATLYPQAAEEGEPLPIEVGQTLYTRPARGDWQETWVRVDAHWVRGYARGVHCEADEISGGLGFSSAGTSGFMASPAHVLLPPGLRLVPPTHPRRVVLRVIAPVDATSWAPGWTSANEEAALTIPFPCGVNSHTGLLTIAASQLVPEGAPPRTR